MLLLGTSEMLGQLVNTFTGDDEYSCHYRENFLQQVQMQLRQKPKGF